MNECTNNTADKLLAAAAELMAEKGFKAVTTKEIAAAAGVSEMTLFRYFGTKQTVLEQVIDRLYYTKSMEELFAAELSWDLRSDLTRISNKYQSYMTGNRNLILILLKESHSVPGMQETVSRHPRRLKELLIAYFVQMQEQGKMIPCSAESQAMLFIWTNYGAFIGRLYANELITPISEEQFVVDSVALFVRGLTP
ncbi:TetR/AcrR family transcriptional regulator [Paenibacillus abyssi]|uniref:HTH tetR-type domain-containing protein n=1 Tax=Paenibacillus abyssi TaxID=1340531 RepID=A0A917FQH7_9BACL|nr:TetR/AcrR family transcriptional regulator [Paenibacillus abyssi]GGF94939.1 hypothetical protein GCM10010916_10430 [Paenibacillus abyssi]